MGIRVFIARFSWCGLILREKGLNVQLEKSTFNANHRAADPAGRAAGPKTGDSIV
jgi:hypothetical protein